MQKAGERYPRYRNVRAAVPANACDRLAQYGDGNRLHGDKRRAVMAGCLGPAFVYEKIPGRGRGHLGRLLVCVLAGNLLLKNVVARPRPCDVIPEMPLLIPQPQSFSFPSGHTMSSFAAATVLLFASWKWGIAAYAMAGVVGFSPGIFIRALPYRCAGGSGLRDCRGWLVVWIFTKAGWFPALSFRREPVDSGG